MRSDKKYRLTLLAVLSIALILSVLAFTPMWGISNFDAIHLSGRVGTATPILQVDSRDVPAEFRVNATPVVQIDDGMTVTGASVFSATKLGDADGGNYINIAADGTLTLVGNATVFDDLRVPVNATRTGAARQPGFAQWIDDGSSSTGVYLFWFDKNTEEELFFNVQLPHAWKQDTNIEPHVHWTPDVNGSLNAAVVWGLEYTWVNIGGTVSGTNTSIITGNITIPADTTLLQDKHYMTELGTITPTGISGVSSMLACRVFRESAAAADDYDADAGLMEIDFHYEIDSLGSRTEYVK